jgi:hypothetical protein
LICRRIAREGSSPRMLRQVLIRACKRRGCLDRLTSTTGVKLFQTRARWDHVFPMGGRRHSSYSPPVCIFGSVLGADTALIILGQAGRVRFYLLGPSRRRRSLERRASGRLVCWAALACPPRPARSAFPAPKLKGPAVPLARHLHLKSGVRTRPGALPGKAAPGRCPSSIPPDKLARLQFPWTAGIFFGSRPCAGCKVHFRTDETSGAPL